MTQSGHERAIRDLIAEGEAKIAALEQDAALIQKQIHVLEGRSLLLYEALERGHGAIRTDAGDE